MKENFMKKSARLGATAVVCLALLFSCGNPSGGSGDPAPSNDATLKSLVLTANDGTIPALSFSPSVISYSTTAAYNAASITVTAIATDSGATVSGTGSLAFSGSSLSVAVQVTAADGATKKTYSVSVSREEASAIADLSALTVSAGTLTPAFSAAVTSYAVYLESGVVSFTIGATAADTKADISGDGSHTLYEGANVFPVAVTAQDGTTTKTYTITAYRATAASTSTSTNAYLASLTTSAGLFSPAFSYDTTSYQINLPNSTSSVTLAATAADSGATITQTSTNSLTSLPEGTTTATISVEAKAGNTLPYTVVINRAASGASSSVELTGIDLRGLNLDEEEVNINWSGGSGVYSATVGYDVISAYLNSYTIPSGASITAVGGDLSVGLNPYTVTITAADGATTGIYTFNITRSVASAQADIDSAFENATLSGSSAPIAGTASTTVAGIRGRLVSPNCSVFTASVSNGAWTASVDVSSTTNGPKILLVYPVDQSGETAGTISYIPVTVSGASGGPGIALSGSFGFASSTPTTGSVVISASRVVSVDGDGNYTLDSPAAMIVKDLAVDSSSSFTLTGLIAGDFVVEAVYYEEGSDYCVIPGSYGSSASVTISGNASLDQELVLY